MSFQKQTLGSSHLSAYLKNLRESRVVSLGQAAQETGISLKYLQALEEGDLSKIPGNVYAKNFLKTYVDFLGGNVEESLRHFDEANVPTAPQRLQRPGAPKAFLTPRRIEWALAVIAVALFLSYFAFEVRNLSASPSVEVYSPSDNSHLSVRTTAVDGRVASQVSVLINGEPIFVKPNGTFHEVVDLQEGLNVITIQAINKKGKTTTIERRIIVDAASANINQ